MNTRQLHLVSR